MRHLTHAWHTECIQYPLTDIINIHFSIFVSPHLTPLGLSVHFSCLQPVTSLLPASALLSARLTSPSRTSVNLSCQAQILPSLCKLIVCTGHSELFPDLSDGGSLLCLCPRFLCAPFPRKVFSLVLFKTISPSLHSSLNPSLILHLSHCIATFHLWNIHLSHIVSYMSLYRSI